jgi:hypothetical protein
MDLVRRSRRRLGEILLERGLITPRQLSDALKAQRRTQERLGRTLVHLGYLSELDMFAAVSAQDGLPFPERFLRWFHRDRGEPVPKDAFLRHRTRTSP